MTTSNKISNAVFLLRPVSEICRVVSAVVLWYSEQHREREQHETERCI